MCSTPSPSPAPAAPASRTVAEIPAVLRCSEGTVKTHLHRARQSLSIALDYANRDGTGFVLTVQNPGTQTQSICTAPEQGGAGAGTCSGGPPPVPTPIVAHTGGNGGFVYVCDDAAKSVAEV